MYKVGKRIVLFYSGLALSCCLMEAAFASDGAMPCSIAVRAQVEALSVNPERQITAADLSPLMAELAECLEQVAQTPAKLEIVHDAAAPKMGEVVQ